jgi:hypothetical protein
MNRKPVLTLPLTLLCVVALLPLVSSDQTAQAIGPDGYSRAAENCLQGIDGPKHGHAPGVRLSLTQTQQCDLNPRHHYLDIHIRISEEGITPNERIPIGEENPAFRCEQAGRCEQAVGGEIMFNHFHEFDGKDALTDGWYELHFSHGLPETGRFRVDCTAPCA